MIDSRTGECTQQDPKLGKERAPVREEGSTAGCLGELKTEPSINHDRNQDYDYSNWA